MSLTIFSLLAILAISNAAVLPKQETQIVNGEDAKVGEIPYQVSLQQKGSNFHFCGGSIFSEYYVITAAHCVDQTSASSFEVVAGTINLNDRASVHEVEQVFVHEKYAPNNSWKNDIALLKVKTPFVKSKVIDFVPMPKDGDIIKAHSVAVVSGWGRIAQNGPATKKLQRATIYIADQSYCENVYESIYQHIFSSHVCAHHPAVEKGACNGDSGGPLMVDGKLAGVVSWSLGCGLSDYPTVYTRVPSFVSWIELTIWLQSLKQ